MWCKPPDRLCKGAVIPLFQVYITGYLYWCWRSRGGDSVKKTPYPWQKQKDRLLLRQWYLWSPDVPPEHIPRVQKADWRELGVASRLQGTVVLSKRQVMGGLVAMFCWAKRGVSMIGSWRWISGCSQSNSNGCERQGSALSASERKLIVHGRCQLQSRCIHWRC